MRRRGVAFVGHRRPHRHHLQGRPPTARRLERAFQVAFNAGDSDVDADYNDRVDDSRHLPDRRRGFAVDVDQVVE